MLAVLWMVSRNDTPPSSPATFAIPTLDKPNEEPIAAADYVSKAKGDEPKHINFPSIDAAGFIEKVGIDQHQQVGSPRNIHLAGWFVGLVKPGQPGLSIIDGHVDGLTDKGIFWSLGKLKQGDTFTIERADGKQLKFRVTGLRIVAEKDTVQYLFSQDPRVVSQLNLVTCAGTFNREKKQYEQRVIVSSQLLP